MVATFWLSIGFFVFNTNLTFLYNIDTEGFKKKQQIASSGIGTHNNNHHSIIVVVVLGFVSRIILFCVSDVYSFSRANLHQH